MTHLEWARIVKGVLVGASLLLAVLAVLAAPVGPAAPPSEAPKEEAQPRVLRPTFGGFERGAPEAVSKRDAAAEDLGLVPVGDGYRYKGSKAERFDAIIERDGTVRFELDPKVQAKLDGVCLSGACKLTKEGRKRFDKKRRRKRGAQAAMTLAALLAEAATGTVTIGSTPWGYGTPVSGPIPGSGTGEPPGIPIATAVGRYGYLPEPAIGMADFMDRTFELRFEMKIDATKADLAAAAAAQERRLERLWKDPSLDAAARRATILAMWSDIDVPSEADGDVPLEQAATEALGEARRKAAKHARDAIVASVRKHAPEGSVGAFSKAELARFNAGRVGDDRFSPYSPVSVPEPGSMLPNVSTSSPAR